MYRDNGMTIALGNASIPVFSGRAVGGSTVVNSGTCYRTPERTFARWRDRFALDGEFSSAGLSPGTSASRRCSRSRRRSPLHLGEIGPIIARGAERLGLRHGPLPRNAPDCDGQGVCCFGCPTGAKRSTDVSYVPEALKRGAQLVTAAHVDAIDMVAGRARGAVSGPRCAAGRKLMVRADAVIVAGGTLMTPLLLKKRRRGAGLKSAGEEPLHPPMPRRSSRSSIAPSSSGAASAGYTVDHFADEGIMLEGGSLPFNVASLGVPWTGKRYVDLMGRYPYLATFGLMIQDESRGEVRAGPGERRSCSAA